MICLPQLLHREAAEEEIKYSLMYSSFKPERTKIRDVGGLY